MGKEEKRKTIYEVKKNTRKVPTVIKKYRHSETDETVFVCYQFFKRAKQNAINFCTRQ